MKGASDVDPVSLNNNSCSWQRRTGICGTCGGNHYRNSINLSISSVFKMD